MNNVFLSLGTNLGDKHTNLQNSIKHINDRVGYISALSSVFETEPWGFNSTNSFFNMAVEVRTQLSPLEVLYVTQAIEKKMGRMAKSKPQGVYEDRIIDIDLILYNDLVFESTNLVLPHPLFHQRKFVLEPLNEIAPDIIHPVLNKTIKELYSSLINCEIKLN